MNIKTLLILLLGVVCLLFGGAMFYYQNSLGAVSDDSTNVMFEVKQGESAKVVIKNLYDANLVNNELTAYIYYRLHDINNLQAGTYGLNRTMDLETILDKISTGDAVHELVQITFLEGKRVPKYVNLISKGFGYTEKEIYDTISDTTYLNELISKYWFLTDEILNKDIYYPLEGYLYPDTYQFSKNATIREVIEKMLDNTASKLEPYKEKLTANEKYSVHDFMTMASIIELEGTNTEDRKKISQVIYNRLDNNDTLGMDVTSIYGAKKEMTDEDWVVHLYDKNPYNTRLQDGSMNGKLPIGPIGNASIDSIAASVNPVENNYWFVANVCTGEVFFFEYKDGMKFVKKANELREVCELN